MRRRRIRRQAKTGKTVRQFKVDSGRFGGLYGLAASPDGRTIAGSSVDHSLHLWDVETGAQLALRADHRGPTVWVGFAADGSALASCSFDGDVKIRDPRSGEVRHTLPCGFRLNRGAFAADGRRIAGAGHERPVVVLWERADA